MDNKFHVLAVDDSLVDRMLIERILKTNSFRVTAVDSVSKALRLLGLLENNEGGDNSTPHSLVGTREEEEEEEHRHQHHHVNLIITDYSMPGMTGYDLLRKIKESEDLKDIPVVIMSSENIPARITRCLEEGAEEFLLKPVRLSDVDKLKPHLLKSTASMPDMAMAS